MVRPDEIVNAAAGAAAVGGAERTARGEFCAMGSRRFVGVKTELVACLRVRYNPKSRNRRLWCRSQFLSKHGWHLVALPMSALGHTSEWAIRNAGFYTGHLSCVDSATGKSVHCDNAVDASSGESLSVRAYNLTESWSELAGLVRIDVAE